MATGDVVGIILQEEPPAASFATRDTRNAHTVWDYDDTADEDMVFKCYLGPNYDGGGLTIEIYAAATSATTGDVVWQVDIERVTDSNQDIDSDGFVGLNTSGAVAVPGTSGHVKKFTVTFTSGADMDSLAASEGFRLKIHRDADNTSATDSVSGDMELWGVVIKET